MKRPYSLDRRAFLGSASILLGSTLLRQLQAVDDVARHPHLKLSLAAYGLRSKLAFTKDKPAAWNWSNFIDFAKNLPIEAIEPTAYYFQDRELATLIKLKQTATQAGLAISGSAIGNNFCQLDDAKLQEQIDSVNQWSDAIGVLGGQTLRIFAGTMPKGAKEPAKVIARCVESIETCCKYAEKNGVILALENHGGITAIADEMLQIVKSVKAKNFGVNLDTGNFHTEDPYGDLAKLAPYAVTVQLKTEVQVKGKPKEPADIDRKLAMLKSVGYRGYVVLEYEAAEDPMTAIPREIANLRKKIDQGR
jgi:sugar phosphate isomerase/epimerase